MRVTLRVSGIGFHRAERFEVSGLVFAEDQPLGSKTIAYDLGASVRDDVVV